MTSQQPVPVQDTKAPEQQAQAATPATPAQAAPTQATDTPADLTTAQTPPAQPAPAPAQTVQTAPAPATPAQPAPTQTAQAAPAPAQPASTPDQVAQAVGAGWPTYDKDGNGALDKTEFGEWMVALRTVAQPGFDPASADGKKWIGDAFAQADKDKSKTVNTAELTNFLTPKSS